LSVRKRRWTTRTGEVKESWIVDYAKDGKRHIGTFKKKKDADAYAQQVGVDIRAGTHTPVSKSITVAQAAEDWIKSVELDGREASTLAQYRQHATHITQRIGNLKLASLTTPRVNNFRDDLLASAGGMSRAMARKVLRASSRFCAMRSGAATSRRTSRSASSRSTPTSVASGGSGSGWRFRAPMRSRRTR
jgi:hypothetical protein